MINDFFDPSGIDDDFYIDDDLININDEDIFDNFEE